MLGQPAAVASIPVLERDMDLGMVCWVADLDGHTCTGGDRPVHGRQLKSFS